MRRRRRPLMRGAMVAGAGYAAGKTRANSNAREDDEQARLDALEAQQGGAALPPPPAAPPPAPPTDRVDQLVKLKELLDSGVLSQAEFDAEKARILAS